MSSETTKRQIEQLNEYLANPPDTMVDSDDLRNLCQAKLTLVQALEIQERMEREKSDDRSDDSIRHGRCSVCGAAVIEMRCVDSDGSAGGGE